MPTEAERVEQYLAQMASRPAWAAYASQLREYVASAMRVGQEAANTFAPGGCPLAANQVLMWARELGAPVTVLPVGGPGHEAGVRAVYVSDPPAVKVQEWSVLTLAEEAGVTGEQALAAHVAHELFHRLEAAGVVPERRFARPRRWPAISVAVLREIAAHEFAQAVAGIALPLSWLVIGGPPLG